MLRTISIISVLLLAFPAFSIAPVSDDIGEVAVQVDAGSITETALSAVKEEYTGEWLGKYAASPYVFGEAYSEILSSSIPFANAIAGKERNGAVDIQDTETGSVLSFVFQDGKIAAMLFRSNEGL